MRARFDVGYWLTGAGIDDVCFHLDIASCCTGSVCEMSKTFPKVNRKAGFLSSGVGSGDALAALVLGFNGTQMPSALLPFFTDRPALFH